jgi:hypothetical protein
MAEPAAEKGHFIRYVGWLREDGLFTLDRGWETPKITTPPGACGDYRLDLLDRHGQPLVSVSPGVDSDVCQPLGGHMKSLRVLAYLPWHRDGARIRLRTQERIVDERLLAPAPPEVECETATVADGRLSLRWHAAHSAPLTYDVAIVQGRRGVKVLDRVTETEASIPVAGIPLEGECQAIILATDGLRSRTAPSGSFVLLPRAPTVTILRPHPGEVFSEDEGISLIGHAIAIDGRSLPDEGLGWRVDGVLVIRGTRVGWVDPLPVGSHTVELAWGHGEATERVVLTVRGRTRAEEVWRDRLDELRRAIDALEP